MTWSLFSLYCLDNFPKSVYSTYMEELENDMIRKRGFIKFGKFNRKVIQVYELNKKISGNELMMLMLNWSGSMQAERKE